MRLSSEDEFLALLDRHFPRRGEGVVLGRGDDAALIECPGGGRLCVTADVFREGAHFRREYFSPREIGAKALAVNVSDLAAMGARPLGFTLCLTAPRQPDHAFFDELFAGMAEVAEAYGMTLAGGDLSQGPTLDLAITAWGEAPAAPLLRGRAREGDLLFVVGDLGLARTGLQALEREGREALERWPLATRAHLWPAAQVVAGRLLAEWNAEERGDAEAPPVLGAMDVSDGLARDVPRLLAAAETGLGAELEIDPEALRPEVRAMAEEMGGDPAEFAAVGGEDYALLGAVAPERFDELVRRLPTALAVGVVSTQPGLRLNGRPLSVAGFDHFAPSREPGAAVAVKRPSRHAEWPAGWRAAGESVIAHCRRAWERGLLSGFNGNVSLRLDDELFMITCAGTAKGWLDLDGLTVASVVTGEPVVMGCASSETRMHVEIYRRVPQARAVVHVHPPSLLALGLSQGLDALWDMPLYEAKAFESRMIGVPALPPGGVQLAEAVGKAAERAEAVFMARHGLACWGRDLTSAVALCEEYETLAEIRVKSGPSRCLT